MVWKCGGRVRVEGMEGKQLKGGRKDVQVSARTGNGRRRKRSEERRVVPRIILMNERIDGRRSR